MPPSPTRSYAMRNSCDFETKSCRRLIRCVISCHRVSEAFNQLREEVALCLSGISTDFTWANDFITSEELREEALELAEGTLGRIRGLKTDLRKFAMPPGGSAYSAHSSLISSAPSLSTLLTASDLPCTASQKSTWKRASFVMTYYFRRTFHPDLSNCSLSSDPYRTSSVSLSRKAAATTGRSMAPRRRCLGDSGINRIGLPQYQSELGHLPCSTLESVELKYERPCNQLSPRTIVCNQGPY